jgi:hypothetical protein
MGTIAVELNRSHGTNGAVARACGCRKLESMTVAGELPTYSTVTPAAVIAEVRVGFVNSTFLPNNGVSSAGSVCSQLKAIG